jgi:hypothetical protein
MRKLLYLFIILIFFYACKPKDLVQKSTAKVSNEELAAEFFVDSLERNSLNFTSLLYKFEMSVENEEKQFSSVGNAKLLKDSMLIVSLTPVLGIELARVRVTNTELIVLNRINKTYFLLPVSDFKQLFGVDLNFQHLQNILINKSFTYNSEIKIASNYTFSSILEKDKPVYHFFYQGQLSDTLSYVHKMNFLPNDKTFQAFSVELPKSKKTVFVDYENFQWFSSVFFPHTLKIRALDNEKLTTLAWEITKIEKDNVTNFSFSIPKNYKKVKSLSF